MKKTKIALALLVSVSMLAGLTAGCSSPSSGGTPSGSKSSSAGGNTNSTASTAPSDSGNEPQAFTYPMAGDHTITYWASLNETVSHDYTNLGETPFGKGLMENTGVNITFQHPPTGGANEQFNLLIADGSLPDVMEYSWQTYPGGPEKAISDGNIYALNDIIDQYCPNLKAYLESRPDVDRQCKTDNGNYYMFPFVRGDPGLQVTMGLMIRQDWLDKLGLSTPTCIDEWHDVLTAFKEKKGASAPFAYEFTMASLTNNMPFAYAYNAPRGFYLGEDGKVHFGAAEEGYKQYLATMNQWYSEGLLDPDIATASFDQVSAKVTSGEAGASFGWAGSRLGVWTNSAVATDPNFNLQPVPYPTAKAGETPKMGQIDNLVPNQGGVAITTSCKDVEAAARMLDWAYSDEGHMYYNFGVEGVSYTMVNGEPVYTDLILNNPDGLGIAAAMVAHIRGNYNGPFVQDLRYLSQYYTIDGQKKSNATWTVPTAANYALPPITPTPEESEEFSAIMNEINTYRDEMTLKYILGTESLDSFDNYVKTLDQLNLSRAIEIEDAALERFNAR